MLIVFVSGVLTKSIQKEPISFFSKLADKDYNIIAVTKGALTQARAKLKPEAFIELSQVAIRDFYYHENYRKWKGIRLLAIDGSTSNLPIHLSVKKEFGTILTGCKSSVEASIARISLFYDVLNCTTLDAQIVSQGISENSLLQTHLASGNLKPGDILLADRGYPSNALLYELHQKGVDLCMRMRSHWNEVTDFCKSNEQSRIVRFSLPRKDKQLQKSYGSNLPFVECRLVAIQLESGEKEVLCTSLLDEQKYTTADMKALYHFRWNIKVPYKLLKVRM
jgi:hypothetical protein